MYRNSWTWGRKKVFPLRAGTDNKEKITALIHCAVIHFLRHLDLTTVGVMILGLVNYHADSVQYLCSLQPPAPETTNKGEGEVCQTGSEQRYLTALKIHFNANSLGWVGLKYNQPNPKIAILS